MENTVALINELEDDRMVDNTVTVGVMMLIFVVVVVSALSKFNWSVPALTEGIAPTAANIGMMWHQLNATGLPNELRMVAENSTGAFERMLLGVTT